MSVNADEPQYPRFLSLPEFGGRVFVDVHGPDGIMPAGTIFFIHALGGSSNQFIPIIESSGIAETHRIILWDFEGHGATPLFDNKEPMLDDYVSTAKAVLDSVEGVTEPITVVGHSMGGLLSMAFAAKYPGTVSRLVLFSPATEIPSEAAEDLNGRAETARREGMLAIVRTWAKPELSDWTLQKSPLTVGLQRSLMLAAQKEGYARAALALASSAQPQYNEITAKTLIVIGEDDPVAPEEAVKYLLENIPESEALTIENARHWPLIEDVERSASALRDFLK